MAMKDILDKQNKNLDELVKTSKQDRLIQLAQLYEEKKIDEEDSESLESIKETKKILQKSLDVNVGISKDIKIVAENAKGGKELVQVDVLQEIKQSIDRLHDSLKKHDVTKRPEKVESANRPFAGVQTGVDPDKTKGKATSAGVKEQSAISERRQKWRDNRVSGLRSLLTGAESKGQGGFLDDWLTKRENKAADRDLAKRERKEFIKGAMENDRGTIGVKNLAGGVNTKSDVLDPKSWNWVRRAKGRANAAEYAGKKFDALKTKEDEAVTAQDAMDRSKSFGYAPKVKDTDARNKAMKELAALPDPRRESQERALARANKAGTKQESSTEFAQTSEEKEEGKAERAKFQADTVIQETKQVETLSAMGATLIQSLEVHKQMLEAIKAGGGAGGGGGEGGGLLDTAMDVAGSLGKRGGKLLGKAGGFLGKAGRFLGKIGPGAIAAGVGELGQMGGEALVEAGHEKLGGAVSTVSTAGKYAGYGAMIGSVVPGVGTAIGAGIGGAIGLGKGLYDNWRNMFGGKKEEQKEGQVVEQSGITSDQVVNNPAYKKKYDEMIAAGHPEAMARKAAGLASRADLAKRGVKGEGEETAKALRDQTNGVRGEGSGTADALQVSTDNLNNTKDAASKTSASPIIAAPTTNISNVNTQNNTTRLPVRHEDGTLNKYIGSRYAAY